MKHTTPAWFSIILALGLMLLLSFTGLYLIEYIVPFARSVKGVENASQAFFESYSGIETSLYDIYSWDIWDEFTKVSATDSDHNYTVEANGNLLPPVWKWLSPNDHNWSTLSQNEPIQLLVGRGRLITGNNRIRMDYRVPNIDGWTQEVLKIWDGIDDIILWQLSSSQEVLFTESGSLINESQINSPSRLNLWPQRGTKWDGSSERIRDFYNSNCSGSTDECVLKVTLIRDLVSSDDSILPYLEYQLRFSEPVPTRFARISSIGKSYGFSKKLELAVPQETTNAAFDFTIFQ